MFQEVVDVAIDSRVECPRGCRTLYSTNSESDAKEEIIL
jgi:hypothetical protein